MTMTGRPVGMSLDQWMQRPVGGGSRGNYVSGDWKDKAPYHCDVWLHPRTTILELMRHPFVKPHSKEDQQTRTVTREVWSDRITCLEDRSVIENQHFRNKDTNKRDYPPQVCPICLMVDYLTELVLAKQIDWRNPLFKFEASDPSKTRIFHVGGFVGMFNGKKLTDAQRAELSAAESTDPQVIAVRNAGSDPFWPPSKWHGPVYFKNHVNAAFAQDVRAGFQYAMCVAVNDQPDKGLQILIEGRLLGGKIQDLIVKTIRDLGEAGDIRKRPYAIRLEKNMKPNVSPSEMYDASRISQIPMTPQLHQLLAATPPLDMANLAEMPNLATLKATMEKHLLVKFDIAPFFAKGLALEAERKAAAEKEAAERAARPAPEVGQGLAAPGVIPQAGAAYVAVPTQANPPFYPQQPPPAAVGIPSVAVGVPLQTFGAPAAPAPDPIYGCDNVVGGVKCNNPMRASETKCSKCGFVYEVQSDPPPPPPPALPPRSAARAAGAPSPAPALVVPPPAVSGPAPGIPGPAVAAPGAPAPSGGGWGGFDPPDGGTDDIPF